MSFGLFAGGVALGIVYLGSLVPMDWSPTPECDALCMASAMVLLAVFVGMPLWFLLGAVLFIPARIVTAVISELLVVAERRHKLYRQRTP